MIPADVANRLRPITSEQPAQTQPAAPSRQLTDVLSDLVPGQRILAEIQAQLPNGAYRAMVAQRDVTLALPFSAKTGDSLELEVVESDGKLTLAFVANRNPGEQGKGQATDSATLSQAGKLISDLLGGVDAQGKKPQPTPLNGNQPLFGEFPESAAQLIPVIKEALTKSGMFYEAHQARWAEGKLPTAALLHEPQGKLSSAFHGGQAAAAAQPDVITATKNQHVGADLAPALNSSSPDSLQKISSQNSIPPDITPLVRQQLDALATQNYVWQGQVWPGQYMQWEIEKDRSNEQGSDGNPAKQWQTRLKLTLPGLGEIDAVMRLRAGGAIDVSLVTDSDECRQRLIAGGDTLRQQLQEAGLDLIALAVQHGQATS